MLSLVTFFLKRLQVLFGSKKYEDNMKERKLKINLKLINYFYILLQTNRFIYKKKNE